MNVNIVILGACFGFLLLGYNYLLVVSFNKVKNKYIQLIVGFGHIYIIFGTLIILSKIPYMNALLGAREERLLFLQIMGFVWIPPSVIQLYKHIKKKNAYTKKDGA